MLLRGWLRSRVRGERVGFGVFRLGLFGQDWDQQAPPTEGGWGERNVIPITTWELPGGAKTMNWERLFDEIIAEAPASDRDIAYLQHDALAPLTEAEIAEITASQRNPFPPTDPLYTKYRPFDPRKWTIPKRHFPESFVDFLRWSNGGNFVNGDREFGMFGTKSIREYLLAYHIPEYMPGAIPFAFDGGGGFYLFDMRNEPVDGEYPIVMSHSGSLSWDEDLHAVLGRSFVEVLSDRGDPNDV